MQWDATQQAGFSSAEPWMPVHPNYLFRNVETQQKDPDSLLNVYKKLIKLRKELLHFSKGYYQPLTFEPQMLMAYLRQTPEEMILVAINFGKLPIKLFLGGNLLGKNWELLFSTKRKEVEKVKKMRSD
jgi:glycosidase